MQLVSKLLSNYRNHYIKLGIPAIIVITIGVMGGADISLTSAQNQDKQDKVQSNNDNPEQQEAVKQDDKIEKYKVTRIPHPGKAAEAYFSPDGKSLIFNSIQDDDGELHHVYTMRTDGTQLKRINNRGEDACSYYFPDGKRIVWTSTRDNLDMPKGNLSEPSDYPQGTELYSSALDGSDLIRLTNNKYYDAEVSVSPDGKWILFTRQIDGNLDLWRMHPDGTGQVQITHTPDIQEGGSFYMPDSETIVFRAWKKADQDQRGIPMNIYTIKHDGTNLKQLTNDGRSNWAPFPAPDGKHVTFSIMLPPHNYEIFLMNLETRELTQITNNDAFDGFPVFSPDGKTITFSSSRDAKPGERSLSLYLLDVSALGLGSKK